jgi:protein-glutamine gamma-glutamyltransferase
VREGIARSLRVSTGMLILSGYLALSAISPLGLALLLLPIVLLTVAPLAERLDRRFTMYRRATITITILYTLSIPPSLLIFGLLNTVIGLVIFIQVYKLLHVKQQRDYYHIFLMAFFLLVAACVTAQEAIVGFALVASLISSVWAFVSLQVYVEERRNPGGSVTVVPINATSMLHAGPPRRFLDSGMVLSLAALCMICLVTTLVIFMFTPRIEAGVFGRGGLAITQTGLNHEVNLDQSGNIRPDLDAVMHVRFPDEPDGRYHGDLLWRATVLNEFTGTGWVYRSVAGRLASGDPSIVLVQGWYGTVSRHRTRLNSRRLVQEIFLDNVPPSQGLPCVDTPWEVETEDYGTYLSWDPSHDLTIRVRGTRSGGLNYRVKSEIEPPSPEQLRRASDNYERRFRSKSDYQLLTYQNLDERSLALARRITEDAPTVYDKSKAIEQWLSQESGILYATDLPPALESDHPVDVFLHDTKLGHCQLFASSMALMLRSLGIPARIVSGYRGAEWDQEDLAYYVNADMAHVWVEVYHLGYGWIAFDPSPPTVGIAGGMHDLALFIGQQRLKARMLWYQNVIGYRNQLNWEHLRQLSLGIFRAAPALPGSTDLQATAAPRQSVTARLAVLLTAFSTCVFALYYFIYRRRPAASQAASLTPDQERIVRLYGRFRRNLNKAGTQTANKTAGEIEQTIMESRVVDIESAEELIRQYNEIRFGWRPLPRSLYARLTRLLTGLKPVRAN